MPSHHIETFHAITLVAEERFGYLLKHRVLEVGAVLASAEGFANGGISSMEVGV
ncbi:MAG: hypothetical protein H0V23_04565 [Nocardioidaceae bacterium]|nr:hypothetical protein [Nocardioidaceae bacterium]